MSMKIYNYASAIVPLLGLLAAGCSAATATNESSGTNTAGASSGGIAGQAGTNSTGSDLSGTTTRGSGGGVTGATGATGSAAGTGAPVTSGSTGSSGASSGSGGTEDAGALPDTGGNAVDATMPAVQGPCAAGTLKPGNTNMMIHSGGASRTYILHVPPKYDGKTRMPMVFDFHGKGSTGQGEMGSGWLPKADSVGIVMVYPDGLYNSWNAGPAGCPILMCCCEPSQDHNTDDAAFIRAVVAKTAQDGCIDLKRVYSTGLSNGGIMSHWLACDAADVFAAIAPASGPNMIDCKPSRPVTVVNFRGKQDTLVPYNGGMSMPTGHAWPSAIADFDKWRNIDQCTDAPVPMPMHPLCQISSKCAGGAEVILCSPNAGHVIYGGAAADKIAVPDVAWEVFQRHSLP
jgi:polyhydroxybutyrate depolymerase